MWANDPGIAERLLTCGAGLLELKAAGRTENPVVLDSATTTGAGLLVFEFLEEGLFFEGPVIALLECLAGSEDQIDPVAQKKEEKHNEYGCELKDRIARALSNVAIGPGNKGDPENSAVDH